MYINLKGQILLSGGLKFYPGIVFYRDNYAFNQLPSLQTDYKINFKNIFLKI